MPRQPDPSDEINPEVFRIDGEDDLPIELPPVDVDDYWDLEPAQYASFEEALDAIQEDSLEPYVLTGFSDITRKQVHDLRRVWKGIEDADARRVIADHVMALGLDDVRLDFMRFFRVLLDDPSDAVRQIAASGLDPYDDPALIDPLVGLATTDPSEDVRLASIQTLGTFSLLAEFEVLDRISQKTLRKVLMGLASDHALNPRLRAAALLSASGDSETPKVREVIAEHFESGDHDLRLGAVRAMGRAYATQWLGILESMLRSTDPDERQAAAQSLSQYGDESVVPMLTQVAREDLEVPVRLEAIAALGTVGGRAALHSLNTLREYVSDDEIESVDLAIAEVEEFIAIEEGAMDDGFLFDPSSDNEDGDL